MERADNSTGSLDCARDDVKIVRARLVVREVAPGIAVRAVILADRPPAALAQIGPPPTPGSVARPGVVGRRVLGQPPMLLGRRRSPPCN